MVKMTLDISQFEDLIKEVKKKIDDAPYWIANEIVNTIKDRIVTDKSYNSSPWLKSNRNTNTLIKSGNMRNAVSIEKAADDEIVVVIATEYAKIHNEGGTIVITDRMRSYFWSQYYKTQDDYWKGMALHKTDYIDIPRRTMVGSDDRKMIENIEKMLIKIIEG